MNSDPCSESDLATIVAAVQGGTGNEIQILDRALASHPDDARLHFLRGSLLVAAGRAIEAHAALSEAVRLAPDFLIARFQLGFFELTSGEPARALESWMPLRSLPADHYLNVFVSGLDHLIHDRFADAVATLDHGIARNTENPPLNGDMALIIARCRALLAEQQPEPAVEATSATSFLLDQLGRR